VADLYVCPEPDCGRTYPDADAFARHCDIAEHGDEPCAVCSEPVRLVAGVWIHPHSGDSYCGCGDGSTAYPRSLAVERATYDPGPYIGSYAASDPWSDARDNRRDD